MEINPDFEGHFRRVVNHEEVREYTKHLLREVAPGGGYCVGSGNSVPNWAKFENYMAMRDTTLKHGSYPITI